MIPHPQRCEACSRPYCESEVTRFKFCPIANHFVLMFWEGKYVPYTQTAQDIEKVGCASHSSVVSERDKVLDELRPEVLLFALSMEHKLRKHDKDRGKEGWHFEGEESEGRLYLLRRLKQELIELEDAMDDCPPKGTFYSEAIDIGNFAMMISYFDHWGTTQYMIDYITTELRQKAGEP